MALKDDDLLAVYRETDQKNYKASVTQLMSMVPSPTAPSLAAVLKTGNVSQNTAIIIEDNSQDQNIVLNSDGSATFAQDVTAKNQLIVGATPKIYLKPDGEIKGNEIQLIGNIQTANAFAIYKAGSDIDDLKVDDQVAVFDNTGKATFTGALEAASIDGGVYGAE